MEQLTQSRAHHGGGDILVAGPCCTPPHEQSHFFCPDLSFSLDTCTWMSCWYYNPTEPDWHTFLPPPSVPHIPVPLVSGSLVHLGTVLSMESSLCSVLQTSPENPSGLAVPPCHTRSLLSLQFSLLDPGSAEPFASMSHESSDMHNSR